MENQEQVIKNKIEEQQFKYAQLQVGMRVKDKFKGFGSVTEQIEPNIFLVKFDINGRAYYTSNGRLITYDKINKEMVVLDEQTLDYPLSSLVKDADEEHMLEVGIYVYCDNYGLGIVDRPYSPDSFVVKYADNREQIYNREGRSLVHDPMTFHLRYTDHVVIDFPIAIPTRAFYEEIPEKILLDQNKDKGIKKGESVYAKVIDPQFPLVPMWFKGVINGKIIDKDHKDKEFIKYRVNNIWVDEVQKQSPFE